MLPSTHYARYTDCTRSGQGERYHVLSSVLQLPCHYSYIHTCRKTNLVAQADLHDPYSLMTISLLSVFWFMTRNCQYLELLEYVIDRIIFEFITFRVKHVSGPHSNHMTSSKLLHSHMTHHNE